MKRKISVSASDGKVNAPLILFGACDRHNLGDLLFPHIAAALHEAAGERGIVFFRAGAAPWHDDLDIFRRAVAVLRERPTGAKNPPALRATPFCPTGISYGHKGGIAASTPVLSQVEGPLLQESGFSSPSTSAL